MSRLLAVLLACGAAQDRTGPLPPEEALKSFVLQDGWTLDLVAAEPDVVSPVAMAFDEDGRLFVAEMRDYPLGPAAGTIRLLEDADGDGRREKSTVFASGIPFPTGVLPWKGGLLVTAAYEVLYLKDTDGDGRADERRTILSGFGRQNTQHLLNGLQFALDNWVYASNGLSGGTVNGVKLNGTDFRFRPDTSEVEPVSGNSQFGNTFDEWGRRFIVRHDNHAIHPVLPLRYLRREPALAIPAVEESISDHGNIPKLFPVSPRDMVFTTDTDSSCAVTVWRGSAFVCEPVLNLVHQDLHVPKGAGFTAKRALEGREFLASRDPWCRPVNLAGGPDGALYVADMQRAVIEHPDYIPKEIQKKLDLNAGKDCGRICRIRNGPAGERPRLGAAASADLVPHLAHENPWWRLTAQRLLVERSAKDAAPAIRALARGDAPFGRLHALHTLEGLGELASADLEPALKDAVAGIREHAIRMAEAFPLKDALRAMADDPDPRVRFQLALSLGEAPVLAAVARRDAADPWVRAAILSSVGEGAVDLLPRLEDLTLIRDLARQVGRRRKGEEPLRWLRSIQGNLGPRERAVLEVLEPLRRAGQDLDALLREAGLDARASEWVAAALALSLSAAAPPARVESIEFLALFPSAERAEKLAGLLGPREPQEVQLAVIRAHGEAIGSKLLEGWPTLTVPVRNAVLAVQLTRPERVRELLDRVEKGAIRAVEFAPHHRSELARHPEGSIRARAKKLLEAKISEDREEAIREVTAKLAKVAGDRVRGEKIFTTSCAICHRLEGKGIKVGPDLEAALGRDRRALLVDLLDPNRAMDPSYQVYVVRTNAGAVINGVVSAETPASLTLRRAAGEETTISRSDIAEVKAWPASLMPDGLESSLSAQDFADLLVFLRAK